MAGRLFGSSERTLAIDLPDLVNSGRFDRGGGEACLRIRSEFRNGDCSVSLTQWANLPVLANLLVIETLKHLLAGEVGSPEPVSRPLQRECGRLGDLHVVNRLRLRRGLLIRIPSSLQNAPKRHRNPEDENALLKMEYSLENTPCRHRKKKEDSTVLKIASIHFSP